LYDDLLIYGWSPSFFEVIACISHGFFIIFTLIMTLFNL
jgi:hypothetical protein